MLNLLIGVVIGTIFSQFILRFFNWGWKKIDQEIGNLEKKP